MEHWPGYAKLASMEQPISIQANIRTLSELVRRARVFDQRQAAFNALGAQASARVKELVPDVKMTSREESVFRTNALNRGFDYAFSRLSEHFQSKSSTPKRSATEPAPNGRATKKERHARVSLTQGEGGPELLPYLSKEAMKGLHFTEEMTRAYLQARRDEAVARREAVDRRRNQNGPRIRYVSNDAIL
eukprot:scaffold2223_cov197-Pinguiococcus_pyrenoidosus.AAC.2